MNLSRYIQERLQQKNILLMTHAIVGYPSLEDNWTMLEIMQKAGVDLVELQFPFTEPTADGPIFVRANQQALKNGVCRDDYFDFMKKATRAFDFPILMMSYYNPVFVMGHQAFCHELRACAADGFILPDLPVQEFGDLFQHSKESGLSPILLCAPTNTAERLSEIAAHGSAFLYCVARKGVTGTLTHLDHSLESFIGRCRKVSGLPLALGFGLSSADDIRQLQGKVEIAIVGSALLQNWQEKGPQGYQHYLMGLVESCMEF